MNDLLSTAEAGAVLGVNDSRVRQLIREGRLPGLRIGGRWAVTAAALAGFARPARGWPKGKARTRLGAGDAG